MTQVSIREDLARQLEQLARQQQRPLDEIIEDLLGMAAPGSPVMGWQFDSESFPQTVISAMAEGVMLLTVDGRIQACNPSAERILGLSADQMIGRTLQNPMWRAVSEDGAPLGADMYPAAVTLRTGAEKSNAILGVYRPDETLVWISINTQAIIPPGNDRPEAVVVTFVDITELKQKELALEETREQLATILSGTADGILVLGPGAHVIYANDKAAHMFGLQSVAEILHRSARDLLNDIQMIDEFGQTVSRQQLPGFLALAGKQPDPVTVSFRLPDVDDEQWYVIKATPVFDDAGQVRFAVIATHNITSRKRSRKALEQERALLRTLIDHMPDLVYVKDLESRFLISNDAHTSALGGKHEDTILGRTVAEFVPQAFAQGYLEDDQYVMRSGEPIINREEQIVYPDGRSAWLLTTKAPLYDPGGKITGLIGISRDITNRKMVETQAVALTIERERAQVLSAFIQDASHEFRTPLSVINTNTYLLERVDDADRQKHLIDGIRDQVAKIVRLVDGLVTMNRLERSTHDGAVLLDLNEILRVVCYAQKPLAEKHELTLTMEPTPYLPEVAGDTDDISLALSEVIGNAIQFTAPGGQIMACTYMLAGHIGIEVRDTGVGVEARDMPHIFERFYRGDVSHTTSGFGLGLAITHKIITDHGGRIEVDSTPGEGSVFRILFPMPPNAG